MVERDDRDEPKLTRIFSISSDPAKMAAQLTDATSSLIGRVAEKAGVELDLKDLVDIDDFRDSLPAAEREIDYIYEADVAGIRFDLEMRQLASGKESLENLRQKERQEQFFTKLAFRLAYARLESSNYREKGFEVVPPEYQKFLKRVGAQIPTTQEMIDVREYKKQKRAQRLAEEAEKILQEVISKVEGAEKLPRLPVFMMREELVQYMEVYQQEKDNPRSYSIGVGSPGFELIKGQLQRAIDESGDEDTCLAFFYKLASVYGFAEFDAMKKEIDRDAGRYKITDKQRAELLNSNDLQNILEAFCEKTEGFDISRPFYRSLMVRVMFGLTDRDRSHVLKFEYDDDPDLMVKDIIKCIGYTAKKYEEDFEEILKSRAQIPEDPEMPEAAGWALERFRRQFISQITEQIRQVVCTAAEKKARGEQVVS